MPTMLTVRRLPQMQSDLTRCRTLLRRLLGAKAASSESDIVRNALRCYAKTLDDECFKAGKLKR